jgi:hypothetical protein
MNRKCSIPLTVIDGSAGYDHLQAAAITEIAALGDCIEGLEIICNSCCVSSHAFKAISKDQTNQLTSKAKEMDNNLLCTLCLISYVHTPLDIITGLYLI